jgi:hypothetical protein
MACFRKHIPGKSCTSSTYLKTLPGLNKTLATLRLSFTFDHVFDMHNINPGECKCLF